MVEMTEISGKDVIMFSAEATLEAGEKLIAAPSSWFGMMNDGFGE